MRSRAVRLTLSAMAVGVLAAAAFFVFQTEQQIEHQRAAGMRFEERIRAVDRALAELRMGLQAYVAAGQSADTWIPKVTGMSAEAARGVDDLRAVAATADARASLMEAAATITDLAQVDRRIVDYLKSGQDVMAADMVYSEAGQKVAQAANQVDAARALEGQGGRRGGTNQPPPSALRAGCGSRGRSAHAAPARRSAGQPSQSRGRGKGRGKESRGGGPG